jgi:hypothetical protein
MVFHHIQARVFTNPGQVCAECVTHRLCRNHEAALKSRLLFARLWLRGTVLAQTLMKLGYSGWDNILIDAKDIIGIVFAFNCL